MHILGKKADSRLISNVFGHKSGQSMNSFGHKLNRSAHIARPAHNVMDEPKRVKSFLER
jgi:hypothetical protein